MAICRLLFEEMTCEDRSGYILRTGGDMEVKLVEGRVTLWSTVLTFRWLRLTLSISGVSGKAVPPPTSSLY